jgi:hypothetical protein
MRPTSEALRRSDLRAIVVALAVLLAATPTRVWSQGTAVPASEVDQAILHVVVLNRGEGRLLRRGTAFHVGGGLFYTNAHIVRRAIPSGYTEWRLATAGAAMAPDTWLGPATIACVHPFWRDPGTTQARPFDVALLRVEAAALPPALSLASGLPQPGVRVRIKGFPAASRGWPPVLYTSEGRIDEVDITEQIFSVRIESGFALGGSSGSPVLADDGRAVGIIFGGTGEGRTASSEGVAVTVPGMQSGCPPRQ